MPNTMHRLVTWKCGHFTVEPELPAGAGSLETKVNDFDAWKMLEDKSTNKHVALPIRCQRSDCQDPKYVDACKERAEYQVIKLNGLLSGGQTWYLQNGQRCALAHQQYTLSTTKHEEDPLLSLFETQKDLLRQAEELIRGGCRNDIDQAHSVLNEAKATVGKIVGPLDEIMRAIQLMEVAPNRGDDVKVFSNDLPSMQAMVKNRAWSRWLSRLGGGWREAAVLAFETF